MLALVLVDVIVPAFEEVFYISTQIERLSQSTKVFASPFSTLARLHDKDAFERLVTQLGLPIPETVLVTSDEQLREAAGRLERYFARGVFSRGGVCCLTNAGRSPVRWRWTKSTPRQLLVQPFLEGETVCAYSTAHQGRVSSHLMYRIPRQRKHSTGIQFEAVDATESLKLIEPVVAELGYTDQISFDFLITEDGLTFVECNPRATDGLLLMSREELVAGPFAPRPETFVLEPVGEVQLAFAVLADGFADQLERLPQVDRGPRAGPGHRHSVGTTLLGRYAATNMGNSGKRVSRALRRSGRDHWCGRRRRPGPAGMSCPRSRCHSTDVLHSRHGDRSSVMYQRSIG